MWNTLPGRIMLGDHKALSRAISLVENEAPGYERFLQDLRYDPAIRITGLTGSPGAGKSTLADALIGHYVKRREPVAVICVDPSSAFTGGALLGDRIRMRDWYNHPDVYIRSLSTKGILGGLHPSIVEITDILRAATFRHIIIETVGVGQSEIEIAALADTTVVVQVPEGGDEVQTMKAGLMEIANVFVVNKCDRPGAAEFVRNLHQMMHDHQLNVPVIKTNALSGEGIDQLAEAIASHDGMADPARSLEVLTRRALQLILKNKMRSVDVRSLQTQISKERDAGNFNLYRLINSFLD